MTSERTDIVLVFTKRSKGGTTIHADELATSLSARGLRCHVVFLYAQDDVPFSFPDVECLSDAPPKGPAAYFSLFWRLAKRLKALRPEVVHASMPMAANIAPLAALLAGARVRTTAQHITMDELRKSQRFLESANSRMGLVQKTICVSQAVCDSFEIFPEAFKRKCLVIENAVPTPERSDDLEPVELKRLRGEGYLTILCVGSLSERKNQSLLIRMAGQVERVALVLAGDGPDRTQLEEQAEQLGIRDRCVFLGFVDKKLVSALYYLTDVTALPSFREGMPLALLEAMASGTCVLASDIPPNRETLTESDSQNTAGYLLPLEDDQKWIDAVTSLRDDAELRRALATNAKTRSLAFSPEECISRYCEAWSNHGAMLAS